MIFLKRLETNSDVDPTIVEIDKKRYFKMLKEDLSKVIAGRSIDEILKRFDNKIRDPRGTKKGENVSKIIKEFLKLNVQLIKLQVNLISFLKRIKLI
jgi:ATP phosphoribosyltransferase regulatory subunit